MSTRERMAARQPDYYKKSDVTKELLNTFAAEVDAQIEAAENAEKELRASTAEKELDRWELDYGVKPDANDSIEERQRKIILQMQAGGTITAETLKQLAESFFLRECHVTENYADYSVTVSALNGVPQTSITAFRNAARKLIPAHLGLDVKMEFNTWGDLKPYTWGQLANYTWSEVFKNKGGIS